MENRFEIFIEPKSDHDRIVLVGNVDEHAQINFAYFANQTSHECSVDFSEIKTVNSVGLSLIIKLLSTLGDRHVTIENCPEPLVKTFIGLPKLEKCTIKSYEGTYFCPQCDFFLSRMVSVENGQSIEKKLFCTDCGHQLELEFKVEDGDFV